MLVNVFADGLLQLGDAVKDATSDALHRQIAKEAFDHVQKGRTGGDPVHVKALVASEPLLHLWGLVGRVVVHDQMKLFVGRRAAVNEFEKPNPVPTIVSGYADVDHASVLGVHGGKQSSGSMPPSVVGHGPTTPLFPGQAVQELFKVKVVRVNTLNVRG